MKQIETLEFKHEGNLYRYHCDKIERWDEYWKTWDSFITLPLSSTKYAKSKEDIETICKLSFAIYEQGRNRGKRDKQIEICKVIGADY